MNTINKKTFIAPFITVLALIVLYFTLILANISGIKEVSDSIWLFEELQSNKSFTVYFGRPSCPECTEVLPILESIVSKNGDSILYFNTDNRRGEEGYDRILEKFEVFAVPMITKVVDGEIKTQLLLEHENVSVIEDFFN